MFKNFYKKAYEDMIKHLDIRQRQYEALEKYSFELQERIDKAIEYIEKSILWYDPYAEEMFEMEGYKSGRVLMVEAKDLLKILKGEQ